jgi:hypothetical protein
MASSSGPPDGARIIHHWMYELPEEQNSVPNGKATRPVQVRAQNTQPLKGFLPYLVDVSRPGQPFIEGHPQIAGCINPHDWLTEESNWSSGLDTPACEEQGYSKRNYIAIFMWRPHHMSLALSNRNLHLHSRNQQRSCRSISNPPPGSSRTLPLAWAAGSVSLWRVIWTPSIWIGTLGWPLWGESSCVIMPTETAASSTGRYHPPPSPTTRLQTRCPRYRGNQKPSHPGTSECVHSTQFRSHTRIDRYQVSIILSQLPWPSILQADRLVQIPGMPG